MGSPRQRKLGKRLFDWARVFHVYTSTALFSLMLFFSITGVTLNHRWYPSSDEGVGYEEHQLDSEELAAWGVDPEAWHPDLSQISAAVQTRFDLPQPHSIDVMADSGELLLDFKVPAGFASVTVDGGGSLLILEKEPGSLLGILNDLHKGRHSGAVWFWLIDISAVLMVLFSLTGLVILYHGRRFKRWGNWSLLAGLITPLLIYGLWVPSL